MATKEFKVAIAGDGSCGKSCLPSVFFENKFLHQRSCSDWQTDIRRFHHSIVYEGTTLMLDIWDMVVYRALITIGLRRTRTLT